MDRDGEQGERYELASLLLSICPQLKPLELPGEQRRLWFFGCLAGGIGSYGSIRHVAPPLVSAQANTELHSYIIDGCPTMRRGREEEPSSSVMEEAKSCPLSQPTAVRASDPSEEDSLFGITGGGGGKTKDKQLKK
ncbi:hypothetical protein MGYG_07069 [Nannizzia gypsea CBS 118893]|uniref:Uncharacterized protein n=1 Tax=Arthroderma gypseum (strain ATCC MYA-4604 / CBS 118893) TaxID=535722 RepID=E4V1Z8_ARTGP|nr:hypothetical protein MGYG_07069 [Nannizzia gypsea CBS 118893]EFR04063.1 hypothetical protein MGYG_07069 [Nannizzia gypsea CBS 118893]